MERSEILTTMSTLKLYGMKAAYDEVLATAVKRQHEPERSSATCSPLRSQRNKHARSNIR